LQDKRSNIGKVINVQSWFPI